SGLFAPWWVVLGLVAVWLVLLVLAIGWTRPRPRTVAVLPFVGLALWLGVVWLG
ncbi:MAG: hypothetical protein H0W95_05025, partial [Nocardioidaceae bacterium]|nr:hypothetical protein [Nocardioidaceae bacterium]